MIAQHQHSANRPNRAAFSRQIQRYPVPDLSELVNWLNYDGLYNESVRACSLFRNLTITDITDLSEEALGPDVVRMLCRQTSNPLLLRFFFLEDYIADELQHFPASDEYFDWPISAQWMSIVVDFIGIYLHFPPPKWMCEVRDLSRISTPGRIPGTTRITLHQALEYEWIMSRLRIACEDCIGDLTYSVFGDEPSRLATALCKAGCGGDDLNRFPRPAKQFALNRQACLMLVESAKRQGKSPMSESVKSVVLDCHDLFTKYEGLILPPSNDPSGAIVALM